MTFDTYLKKNGISTLKAAEALKKTRQHIWEIRTRRAFPSYKLTVKIYEWTNHQVSFVDFKRN